MLGNVPGGSYASSQGLKVTKKNAFIAVRTKLTNGNRPDLSILNARSIRQDLLNVAATAVVRSRELVRTEDFMKA